jgi:RNA polymerase sigma-70 factor (ECF subfamily)
MTDPDRERRFTALYDIYQPRVYAYVVSRAGREIADEVVSETFLVAWRRLADVPKSELAWLLGVARNILREQYRADVRRKAVDAELRIWSGDLRAGDVADHVAERSQVLAALATLSDDDREILTLVAWHGLAPWEAARVVGCSAATYSVRLHRARRRLEHAMSSPPAPAARPAVLTLGKESSR